MSDDDGEAPPLKGSESVQRAPPPPSPEVRRLGERQQDTGERVLALLRWYVDIRAVVASFLLVVLLGLGALRLSPYPLQLPVGLCLLELAVNAIWYRWLKSRRHLGALLQVQFLTDLLALTAGIHLTGGPYSPFIAVYNLPIVSAGLLGLGFAVQTATQCSVLLSVLLMLNFQVSSPYAPITVVGVNVSVFYLTATVISYYRIQIRQEKERLQSAHAELARAYDDLERYEQQMEVAHRDLQAVARARSEFLGLVSHELRTPLNSVIGFAGLMLDETFPVSPEERTTFLHHIHNAGNHLLAIIDNIIDLTRVDVGDVSLDLEAVDLGKTLRELREVAGPQTAEREVNLVVDAAPGVPAVRAEPRRLRQVLLILVDNAIKFNRAGGEVRVSASVDDEAGSVVLEIADTGHGIPPDALDHIFEPFYQVDSSTTRQHEGTGLGLTVARALVSLQGGRIWAESRLGEGSRFCFSLPVASRSGVER